MKSKSVTQSLGLCVSRKVEIFKKKSKRRRRKQILQIRADSQLEFVECDNTVRAGIVTAQPLSEVSNYYYPTVEDKYQFYGWDDHDTRESRRRSIALKLMKGGVDTKFTKQEEFDILQRINKFLETTIPDIRYCISPGQSVVRNPYAGHQYLRRPNISYHTYTINDQSYYINKENDVRPKLPNGTHLLKPSGKLVELVAIAIDESPDGVLQVHHVYSFLMKRYPYFAFMDKLSTNSWRSSIRHALYQKWFQKILISDDKISNKGCFWMINREHRPKEWSLPASPGVVFLDNITPNLHERKDVYDTMTGFQASHLAVPSNGFETVPAPCQQCSIEHLHSLHAATHWMMEGPPDYQPYYPAICQENIDHWLSAAPDAI